MGFRKIIRDRIKSRGSITEFSSSIGKKQSQVSRFLNGAGANFSTVEELASALGLRVDVLPQAPGKLIPIGHVSNDFLKLKVGDSYKEGKVIGCYSSTESTVQFALIEVSRQDRFLITV